MFYNFINSVLRGSAREEFPTSSTQPTYKDNSTWSFSGGTYNWNDMYYDYSNEQSEGSNEGEGNTETTNDDSGGESYDEGANGGGEEYYGDGDGGGGEEYYGEGGEGGEGY